LFLRSRREIHRETKGFWVVALKLLLPWYATHWAKFDQKVHKPQSWLRIWDSSGVWPIALYASVSLI
jgi:hypothetical protein